MSPLKCYIPGKLSRLLTGSWKTAELGKVLEGVERRMESASPLLCGPEEDSMFAWLGGILPQGKRRRSSRWRSGRRSRRTIDILHSANQLN